MKIRNKMVYEAVQVLNDDEVCEWFKENVIDTRYEERDADRSFITKDDISTKSVSLDFCYDPFNKDVLQRVIIHMHDDGWTEEAKRGDWIYLNPGKNNEKRHINVVSKKEFNDWYEVAEDKN